MVNVFQDIYNLIYSNILFWRDLIEHNSDVATVNNDRELIGPWDGRYAPASSYFPIGSTVSP